MHVQDIILDDEWINLSQLVSFTDENYTIVNCSNNIIWLAESGDGEPDEGQIPLSPSSQAGYVRGSQELYVKGLKDNRISIYKAG